MSILSKKLSNNKLSEQNKNASCPPTFKDLHAGQVFIYLNGETYYMKLITGDVVNLRSGDFYTQISPEGKVRIVHKLTISDAESC